MPPWTFNETPAPGAVVVWTVGSAVLVPEADSDSEPVLVEVLEAVLPEALDVVTMVVPVSVPVVPVVLASVVVVSVPVSVSVAEVVLAAEVVAVSDSVVDAAEVVALELGFSTLKRGVKL